MAKKRVRVLVFYFLYTVIALSVNNKKYVITFRHNGIKVIIVF
jgi:hypothetical protein